MRFWTFQSLKGQSPIESLIATAILLGVVTMTGVAINSHYKNEASLRDKNELDQLRLAVMGGLHCGKTISALNFATDCQAGAFDVYNGYATGVDITLRRPDNQPIFTNNKMGDWHLKSRCVKNATDKSLVVYVSKRKSAAGPAEKDAGNKSKTLDWTPLFRPGTPLCFSEIASPTSVPVSLPNITYSSIPFAPTGPPYSNRNLTQWSNAFNCSWNQWPWFADYYALHNHVSGTHHIATATCPANYASVSPVNLGGLGRCLYPSTTFTGNDPAKMVAVFPCHYDRTCIDYTDIFEANIQFRYLTTVTHSCVRIR